MIPARHFTKLIFADPEFEGPVCGAITVPHFFYKYMKIYTKTVLAAVAALFVFGTLAATPISAQGQLRQILQRMENYNKNLTTLRAQVTMGKQNAQLGDDAGDLDPARLSTRNVGKRRFGSDRLDKSPEESLSVVDGKYTMYRKKLARRLMRDSVKDKTKNAKAVVGICLYEYDKGPAQCKLRRRVYRRRRH